jgi:uncharacterized membrane protein
MDEVPMRNFFGFLKTTIVGGVVFLVPIIVFTIILGKALGISRKIVAPLSALIPIESVAGVGTAKLLAIATIVFFCFVAGLFAKTGLAKKIVDWLESSLLSQLPGYSFMKSMGESIAGIEKEQNYEPVLAWIEEAWQIAFLVERIESGHVAVFVPGAPSPWSGAVFIMTIDRIKPLNMPISSALKCIKNLGAGSNEMLKGRL